MKKIKISNKIILAIFSLLLFLNCKKEESIANKTFTTYVNRYTDLSKYKLIKKNINDSIIKISGKNNDFYIEGFLDSKTNKKIRWWKIVNLKDSISKLRIQYVNVDNQTIANQILFYEKTDLDTLNSKFYIVKEIDNHIKYCFYLPGKRKSIISSKFHYLIDGIESNKVCHKKSSHYECLIEKPNNKYILGLFTEAVDKGKNADLIEIFTTDTIK